MSFIRKITNKNKDGTTRTYYAEVESIRIDNKVKQRYIRFLGRDPNKPNNFSLGRMEFSTLSLGLMHGELTANDVFDLLEQMGHPCTRDALEKIGIRYDFKKKTFSIYLYYQKKSKASQQKDAKDAKSRHIHKKHIKE